MNVVILHDAGGADWTAEDVAAVMANVREVRRALRRAGHAVRLLPVRLGDVSWIARAARAELVFNLCEGIGGHARYEDFVAGALELTGVPVTGCRAWPVSVCHRKSVANTLLQAAGVPIPPFALARANGVPETLPLPAIVKPDAEDASVGIDAGAVCTDRAALRARVARLLEQFDDVLVQRYVPGREFNVGFIGREALPVSEIRFGPMPPGHWPILTYAAKWHEGSDDDRATVPVCPAPIDDTLRERLVAVARQAWMELAGGEGYGRVDLRVDEDGAPWVLEVNPMPDLSSNAGLARMARAAGLDYDALVRRIVDEAMARGVVRVEAPVVERA